MIFCIIVVQLILGNIGRSLLTKKNRGFHVSNGPYVIIDMVYDLFAGRKDVERN